MDKFILITGGTKGIGKAVVASRYRIGYLIEEQRCASVERE